MRTNRAVSGFSSDSAQWILLTALGLGLFCSGVSADETPDRLSLEDRIAGHAAVARVYFEHQQDAPRRFEDTVNREILEARVRRTLRQTVALERLWQVDVAAEHLLQERRRIERQTVMPERLDRIYAALGYDARLIDECFVRPVLVDRLVRNFYAYDGRFHGASRRNLEAIRRGIVDGTLDASDDHPLRAVIERHREEPGALDTEQARPDPRILDPETFSRWRAVLPETPGEVPDVAEGRHAFELRLVFDDGDAGARAAVYRSPKQAWDLWWKTVAPSFDGVDVPTVATAGRLSAPTGLRPGTGADASDEPSYAGGPCPSSELWSNGVLESPVARGGHTAVWTGTEMIIWGGYSYAEPHNSFYVPTDTGSRYDPLTDTWTRITREGAPDYRHDHEAVWTGTEMIVWGGDDIFDSNTGGRYDPINDSWSPMSTVGAPSFRVNHTAVWTGEEMIVWGGYDGQDVTNTGSRYDPQTDTWSPMASAGGPSARTLHTAVWTGEEMVVWGGAFQTSVLGTGARYDPTLDAWTAVSSLNAPFARSFHSAVWTGSEMIVWGGFDGQDVTDTGSRYDPQTDTWTPTSLVNAAGRRSSHTAVWSANRMVVLRGGRFQEPEMHPDAVYDPVGDSWQVASTLNAPIPRIDHTSVSTGDTLLVWGGRAGFFGPRLSSGARYDLASDTWTPTSNNGGPESVNDHTAVWTGNEMIVWGGLNDAGEAVNTGARYDPLTDQWTATSAAVPDTVRSRHVAVWSGSEMIVWGGGDRVGGRYDPLTDSWQEASATLQAPLDRPDAVAAWTGAVMVVWGGGVGGSNSMYFRTGGRYDPATDSWQGMTLLNAPTRRYLHSGVWADDRLIVWGGFGDGGSQSTGGRYDPVADVWLPTSTIDVPPSGIWHTAVWTGDEMIIWGAADIIGGRYDPIANVWTYTSPDGAPAPRRHHSAVWTGKEMILWGGRLGQFTGGRYDPVADSWAPTTIDGAPDGRFAHVAVWTGEAMLLWGGEGGGRSGGRYFPEVINDADTDGVCTEVDCNDADPQNWATPGAAGQLLFNDAATLDWSAPANPGGTSITYEALRSSSPGDFAAPICIDAGNNTQAYDPAEPLPGMPFTYLVRAVNDCPAGLGSTGSDSSGQARAAGTCPAD